ncbi:MAG TPA: hypothetical protein VK699_06510 [Terriglobales bacterium]|nr:hypothetical protein [Terriglobales bacterium]
MIRIGIVFGMSLVVSLMCFAQGSAAAADPRNLTPKNCCHIALAEQTRPQLSFAACHASQREGQKKEDPSLTLAALKLPQSLADTASENAVSVENGLPEAPSGGSYSASSLPDAASSTRIALTQNGSPAGRDRVPVAVYPIIFPYTPREKFGLFVRDIYDPFNFMAEAFNALWAQSQGDPRAYGGGMGGYGRRLGAMVGTDIVGEFTGTFLFPSILHTDPRYFRMARGSLRRRFFYAVTRQLIAKSDSGDDTWNASRFLSGLATTAVSGSYYPHRDRSFPGIVQHTLVNMGFDALDDSFREFWPDLAHRLHLPTFVIRRTADPTFIDPMDPQPMPITEPANPRATPSPTDKKAPGLPQNLQ